jgi:hypothetical protein
MGNREGESPYISLYQKEQVKQRQQTSLAFHKGWMAGQSAWICLVLIKFMFADKFNLFVYVKS